MHFRNKQISVSATSKPNKYNDYITQQHGMNESRRPPTTCPLTQNLTSMKIVICLHAVDRYITSSVAPAPHPKHGLAPEHHIRT